jgi:hypothetical protein
VRRRLAVIAVVCLAGCTATAPVNGASRGDNPPATEVRPTRWTGAALRYGAPVSRQTGITYQPGVVFVGGGPDAVRSVSADGLVWTIDATTPGLADLRVGNVMLFTNLGSGRVLALRDVGTDMQVLLGPVSLTDVIRDGTFASAAPIPLADGLYYSTSVPSPPAPASPSASLSAYRLDDMAFASVSAPPLPPPSTTPTIARQRDFTMQPVCCNSAYGIVIGYDNGAGRLLAKVRLNVGAPSVTFHVRIGGSKVLDAGVSLQGAAGLSYHLEGSTTSANGNVKSGPINIPGSLTIPITGPFSLTLSQAFAITMQIGGAGQIIADGDYRVTGALGFDTAGGAHATGTLKSGRSLAQNATGPSLAPGGISIGWSLRATLGIGLPPLLSAGIWYELDPGLALIINNTALTLPKEICATAAINVADRFGVGYRIPKFLASAISTVLSIFGAAPIPPAGGPSWGPYKLYDPPQDSDCHQPPP